MRERMGLRRGGRRRRGRGGIECKSVNLTGGCNVETCRAAPFHMSCKNENLNQTHYSTAPVMSYGCKCEPSGH